MSNSNTKHTVLFYFINLDERGEFYADVRLKALLVLTTENALPRF